MAAIAPLRPRLLIRIEPIRNVLCGAEDRVEVITQMADPRVAATADPASELTRYVAVIERPTLHLLLANRARLPCCRRRVLKA